MSFVLHVNTKSPQPVSLDIMSTDGMLQSSKSFGYTAFDGETTGMWSHTVTWDKEHASRTVEYWIQTVAPSRMQSARKAFTINCRAPGG